MHCLVGSFWCIFGQQQTMHHSSLLWQQLGSCTWMIQATCPCKCTCDCSPQEVPLSEGVSCTSTHVPVPHHDVDLLVDRNSHSGASVTSTTVPAHEGAVSSETILETDSHTPPCLQTTTLQLLDDHADLMNQQSSIIKASPSPVPAWWRSEMTMLQLLLST